MKKYNMNTFGTFEKSINDCKHEKHIPKFDSELAKNMSWIEVREKFPRYYGKCEECGESLIAYASTEHFVMGDW
jgi:hypothetical protein